jgi:predicted ABC-type ATPase
VTEGGHHIPEGVVRRRYQRGIENLFNLFFNEVDYLLIFDNTGPDPELIAEKETQLNIFNISKFEIIKALSE